MNVKPAAAGFAAPGLTALPAHRPASLTRAGISVGQAGVRGAVIIADGSGYAEAGCLPVMTRSSSADPAVTLDAIGALAPRFPDLVVVDISAMLLDAVVRSVAQLQRVAVIRIVPRPATDPVLARSPAEVVERLVRRRFTVLGGHDLLGHELCPLDLGTLTQVCGELAGGDMRHVAIVAAGSQARPEHERAVADAVQAAVPGARISLASDFGGHGLVAREATLVLDCALGVLADSELALWEMALARRSGAALRVARGDGGFSTPARVRALPSLALGACDALALAGAAYLAGQRDCRVVLPRDGGQVAGDIRNGLPVVRPGELRGIATELVAPTAALASYPRAGHGGEALPAADVPVITGQRDPVDLACLGAAVARPTAWLDEVASISSPAELDRVRLDAEERATAIVMANGAEPGTAHLTELSVVAVPYSPFGTVRVRVRVVGAGDLAPAPALAAGGS